MMKSSQVSRTLLSILVDLNAVVLIVSARAPIFKSSSPCTNPLGILPGLPTATVSTVIFMFHYFFSSQGRSRYLSLFLLSLIFTLWSAGTTKSPIR